MIWGNNKVMKAPSDEEKAQLENDMYLYLPGMCYLYLPGMCYLYLPGMRGAMRPKKICLRSLRVRVDH